MEVGGDGSGSGYSQGSSGVSGDSQVAMVLVFLEIVVVIWW